MNTLSLQEAGLILRLIANQKLKPIFYKEHRPYMVVDKMEFQEVDVSNFI